MLGLPACSSEGIHFLSFVEDSCVARPSESRTPGSMRPVGLSSSNPPQDALSKYALQLIFREKGKGQDITTLMFTRNVRSDKLPEEFNNSTLSTYSIRWSRTSLPSKAYPFGAQGLPLPRRTISVSVRVYRRVKPASRWIHKVSQGPYEASGYPFVIRLSDSLRVLGPHHAVLKTHSTTPPSLQFPSR